MEMQSATVGKIAEALCRAQAELPAAIKGCVNPHLKNRYADLNAIYEAARETLARHDLAVVQTMQPTDGTRAHVRTTLLHKSGEWIAGELVMPLDRQGGAQGMGSAITYARRYSLSAIVGIVTEDDDDGNAAQCRTRKAEVRAVREKAAAENPEPPTQAQFKALMAYLSHRHGDNREEYLAELSNFFGREIESSKSLTRAMVSEFLDAINGEAA